MTAVRLENISLNAQFEGEFSLFGIFEAGSISFCYDANMKNKLNERVILITGGGTGIGRATAILCAKEGMKVAVSGRRIEKLDLVVKEIEALGGAMSWCGL